ncbi:MAG: HYC_CC_PP family protein [Cyclobacteriaceae bacterium]
MFTAEMRRLSHIFLSLILVVSTMGMTISKHYCGDMLLKTAINKQVETCSDKMAMPEGCCHEESQSFVVEDDYQLESFQLKSIDLPLLYVITYYELALNKVDQGAHGHAQFNPLTLTGPPIYLQVESLLL